MSTHTIDNDDGFGLVEIVVSMFMLAILALAFLPLLIQGMKQSVENTTRATAVQLLNEQLQLARLVEGSCADVRTFALTPVPSTTDPRGIELEITMRTGRLASDPPSTPLGSDGEPLTPLADCPADVFPGTIGMEISVIRTDTGTPVAEATTLVTVTSAGAP